MHAASSVFSRSVQKQSLTRHCILYDWRSDIIDHSQTTALKHILSIKRYQVDFQYISVCYSELSPLLQVVAFLQILDISLGYLADCMQHRAARCLLDIHKSAPSLAVQGDMGWIPGSISRKCEMFGLWSRLLDV